MNKIDRGACIVHVDAHPYEGFWISAKMEGGEHFEYFRCCRKEPTYPPFDWLVVMDRAKNDFATVLVSSDVDDFICDTDIDLPGR